MTSNAAVEGSGTSDISNVAKLSRTDAKMLLRAIRILAPTAVDKALAVINESWAVGRKMTSGGR